MPACHVVHQEDHPVFLQLFHETIPYFVESSPSNHPQTFELGDLHEMFEDELVGHVCDYGKFISTWIQDDAARLMEEFSHVQADQYDAFSLGHCIYQILIIFELHDVAVIMGREIRPL